MITNQLMKPIKRNSKLFQEVVEYMTEAKTLNNSDMDIKEAKSRMSHSWVKLFKQEDGVIYVQCSGDSFHVKYEVNEDERCDDCGHTPATGACFYCKQD